MKTCLRAYLVTAMFACLLLSGCSDGPNPQLDEMKKRLDVEIGMIDKVSVLSTDGQEFPIELADFTNNLKEQGKDLKESVNSINREDVRYTVILSRKTEAPLVIEVGSQGSQFANKTYRGNGAERFYRWIRDITGQSLFQADIRYAELNADDLNQSISLSEGQAEEVWQYLRTAEHVDSMEEKQYPLYPHYRLKLDTGDKMMDATVLTPTLLSVKVGVETHYFHVKSELFSKLTQWLPLREKSADSLDSLFRVSEIRIVPMKDKSVRIVERKIADSTVEQALSHELIRLLKQAKPLGKVTQLPNQERYQLIFLVNEQQKVVQMYDRFFLLNGQIYEHSHLDQQILKMVSPDKK